ncbi:MAG: cation-transporting P-type ATPase [Planctomycetes bacterium]|nr:cation-transporting P-type ATPase [Planctomycetota bacterium]
MAESDYYQMAVKAALEELGTSREGLTAEEVNRRRDQYGENELITGAQKPKFLMFLSQFKDLLVLVLVFAGLASYGIAVVEGNWDNFRDGSAMFVIVFLNAIIGFVQEYKASRIVEQLRELIRSPADVVRGGEVSEVDQRDLVPGDTVRIEEGDKIPADMRLIEAFNLRTNEFSLTGESMPQEKQTNAIKAECVIGDRDNVAYIGTTVASGTATGLVVRTGMETELGKIATMTEETEETESPLQEELDLLARRLTAVVVVISAILFGVALWQGLGWLVSITYALGVAVACVPQALPAQLTVAMSTASSRLADKSAVVKSLPSVETLGSTSVICTDKTGTLTRNEMTVTKAWFDGKEYQFTGIGYEPEGDILDKDGEPLSEEQIAHIETMMDAATMASNAEIHPPDEEHSNWYPIGDPTEAALVTMSTKIGTRSPEEDVENPELQEFPFTSERKRMSSVRQFGERHVLTMKGSTDSILSISKHIHRNGQPEPISEDDKEMIQSLNESYSDEALRVLAVAQRPLEPTGEDYAMEEVEKDVVFLGLIGMIDPAREGVKEAVQECHDAHIKTYMVTGDHATTAKAIAREIALAHEGETCPVITGKEMGKLSDDELVETMRQHNSMIFSRVDPADKLRVVELLEDELDEVVAVTGDGVNDAPALKRAHIGVAMGRTGTDVAKEAAEVVLLDDSFPTLVNAVEEGRTIYDNIAKVVLASLTTNVAELMAVLLGLVGIAIGNMAIPILAIQILAIDLLAEIMPLTFLCFDPPVPELMKHPPRRRGAHILNAYSGLEVGLLGVLIGALGVGNFMLYMARHGISLQMSDVGSIEYARASTMTWLTIGYCQFVNILSRRYSHTSIFNRNIITNRILLGSIFISIGLMLLGVYAPYVSGFLQFAGIGLVDWLYVFGAAAFFLVAWEGLKLARRTRRGSDRETNS